jgi:hypothetical protein
LYTRLQILELLQTVDHTVLSGGARKKISGGPLKIVIYKLNTKIILHKNI